MTVSSVPVIPQLFKTFVAPIPVSVDYWRGRMVYAQGGRITDCATDEMTRGFLDAESATRNVVKGGLQ